MTTKEHPEPDAELANPGDVLPSPFEDVGTDVVSQAVMAAITGSPALGVALAGLFPILERGSRNAVREIRAGRRRRRAVTLISAAGAAGDQRDEMLRRIQNDPTVSGLVEDALNAGENSMYPSRLRAIGAALAAGVLADDTDTIDVEQMVIRTFSRLERPHVRMLARMTQWTEDQQPEPASTHEWSRAELFNELESLRPVLTRLLADLVAAGLLRQEVQGGTFPGGLSTTNARSQERWVVSDFGLEWLHRLYLARLSEDPIIQRP